MPRALALVFVLLGAAVQVQGGESASERVALAERYFRAVYGGDAAVLDQLASPDVIISYPLFADILGTPAIQGLDAARGFAARFSQRWTNPRFEFHDSVSDGANVVLIWSFAAQRASPSGSAHQTSTEEQAWGGITLIRFDSGGKVVAEIGEESTPGPMGRLRALESE